jgi:hypothetical protein
MYLEAWIYRRKNYERSDHEKEKRDDRGLTEEVREHHYRHTWTRNAKVVQYQKRESRLLGE